MIASKLHRVLQILLPTAPSFAYLEDVEPATAQAKWPGAILQLYTQGLVRFDDTPEGFDPPTQEQVDAAIAQLDQPPTPAEKLAAAGLTVQELRSLLGIPE